MSEVDFILTNQTEFLKFLKSKFRMIHNSNVFFRDFHYGIMEFLREHGIKKKYQSAELIAQDAGKAFEQNGIFKKIDYQTWMLNYPDFALPRVEKKPPNLIPR